MLPVVAAVASRQLAHCGAILQRNRQQLPIHTAVSTDYSAFRRQRSRTGTAAEFLSVKNLVAGPGHAHSHRAAQRGSRPCY
jgi:hypothetical protein